MSVRIEHMDFVTTVIIDRVDARNAVDEPTAEALMQAFVAFDINPNARVAVLWGTGGTFCAGYDLKYASTLAEPETFRREFADKLPFPNEATHVRGPMGPSRLALSKPVIAAVEGASVAGGMELALWCDLRVMAEDAFFGVYCRRWGIPLIDVGTLARIRDGTISLRGAISHFTADRIVFTDAKEEAFDAVILATGFRPDLRRLLPDLDGVLDERGFPLATGRMTAAPGLYFCGQITSPTGQLREIAIEARQIAKSAAAYIARSA